MSTLAEAKAQLGYLDGLIKAHGGPAECVTCWITKGKRCDELKGLHAMKRELAAQIRTWFDPPRISPAFLTSWSRR